MRFPRAGGVFAPGGWQGLRRRLSRMAGARV